MYTYKFIYRLLYLERILKYIIMRRMEDPEMEPRFQIEVRYQPELEVV